MKLISDLHLHSKYSRATSPKMNPEFLAKAGKEKGLHLLGTGDFTHPKYIEELKKTLEFDSNSGFYKLNDMFFVPTAEISLMYSQGGKGRRVHLCLHAPDFEVVEQINAKLDKWGRRDYDGRPIFGKSVIDVVDMVLDVSKDIEIIPAHAWTPWFGIFGSKGGFDSLEEAFQDRRKHIHAIETGLSCYDSETEVLTNKGWKSISDVEKSDEVCTLNISNNEVEFQHPVKLFKYKYKGKMYKLKTKRVDLLVTPNHKLLVSHCDFRKKPSFSLKKAEDSFNKSKRFKKDGVWKGKNLKYFTLPAVKVKHGSKYYSGLREKKEKKLPMKKWLKFFGFWIADGWTTKGKNGDYNVCIANKNKEIISEMKKILKEFGYNPYYDDKIYSLRVRDYQLFNYLKQFGKAADKFIPKDIKLLSKELIEIMFRYYIKGDGHIYGRDGKGLSATTISVKLRDDLQEIALKIGFSAYYKLHNKKGTPFVSPGNKKVYNQNEDSWNIYFIRQNIHTVIPSTIRKFNYIESWVDFDDYVYCVSVPNKVIYVRRNGIPVWCGNSDPEMNWRLSQLDEVQLVSNSDSHSPWSWRIGREATIFEINNYGDLLKAIRTGKGLESTIETSPEYGKYHWDGHRTCGVSFSPKESKKLNYICPKCKKPLTIGVEFRIEELADREAGFKPKNAKPFVKLLPLAELISHSIGVGLSSKKVFVKTFDLINGFGSELNVLLNVSKEELERVCDDKLVDFIMQNREGNVKFKPGFDGEYGVPQFKLKEYPQKTLGSF